MARKESKREMEKAYRDIEELIAESTMEQTQAIYLVASGITRCQIEAAIVANIKNGNSALRTLFPGLGAPLPSVI